MNEIPGLRPNPHFCRISQLLERPGALDPHPRSWEREGMAKDTHSKLIGYLLWIFGFTGAHRFYYGKPITGTIWFFTFGLLGVGWLIDLLLIPGMDAQADRRYTGGRIDYNLTWILLTFLGVFGVHRFYMGKICTGIIWLLTGGFFFIGYLYDMWTLNEQVSSRNRRG